MKEPTPFIRNRRAEEPWDQLVAARAVVTFVYRESLRAVEAHLLGYNSAGQLELSAWQLSGGSSQGFRYFLIGDTRSLMDTGGRYTLTRPGFNPHDERMKWVVASPA